MSESPETTPLSDVAPTFANTGVLTHHDLGCRCWPHVSERDALDAIAAVGLAEYRDGKRAGVSPSTGDDRLREAEFLRAVDGCIAIVQQTLDGNRADLEDEPESRSLRTSIAAREHVIQMLTGYRTWGLSTGAPDTEEPTRG